MNEGQNASLGDGHTGQQFVQLLVVANGQLQVTWDDALLVQISGSVAGQFDHFGHQILEDGGHVDRSAHLNDRGILALLQQTTNSGHGKDQATAGRLGHLLGLDHATFATARHFCG